jgi:hypothetical protein
MSRAFLAAATALLLSEVPGPRMSMSGPWLTRRPAIVPAGYQIEVTSPEQAGRETEPLIAAGVDVIQGNPLFDITALSHVETVIKGGRVYKEPRQ